MLQSHSSQQRRGPAVTEMGGGGNTAIFATNDGVVLVDTKIKGYGCGRERRPAALRAADRGGRLQRAIGVGCHCHTVCATSRSTGLGTANRRLTALAVVKFTRKMPGGSSYSVR